MSSFTSCNPATGEIIFTRPPCTVEQLQDTLRQLRIAQPAWSQLATEQRATQLLRLADSLSRERLTLAKNITLEVGKRTEECLAEIDKSIQLIRYYAKLAPKLLEPVSIPTQASKSGVIFEPLGVILAIIPWNYPIWQIVRFAIPALMAGNTCLVKPAPVVPLSTQKLRDCVIEAELAVLDIAWIAHEHVEEAILGSDAVAFTGSTATGRIIASMAGRHLKKTVLELGGSNPFIVLADADVEAAAHEAVYSRFRDAGQSCNAAKRMIVVPQIAEAFANAFIHKASQLVFGDPTLPTTTLAPLTRADLRSKLHEQVLDAIANGAKLCLGGQLPEGAGFFYPATVLDYVTSACRVYHEEVFGPVASLIRAQNEEEAIRIANDTPFGLGATIYTKDSARGWELARQIEAGSIFINRRTSSDLRLPFGGVKASGYGRELSEFGLYEFVNVKTYWQR